MKKIALIISLVLLYMINSNRYNAVIAQETAQQDVSAISFSPDEQEMLENLDLLMNYDLLENIEMLENYQVLWDEENEDIEE